MDDLLTRFWTDLVGRLTGPLSMRLFLQPVMASLLAVRDGLKDAKAGQPPYLWTIFSDPSQRRRLIQSGWKAIGKIAILAIILDVVYGLMVFRRIYPFQTIVVAILLAVVPYCLLRGPTTRLARRQRSA